MTDQPLAIEKSKTDRIAPWGDRNEIREIARRVQLMAPGAKKLKENEALALAQGAVSHGLDPFNGEIWYIPGSGLMAGIKGLRKAARQQIAGNFWAEFEEITDPDERKVMMIPEGALAYRCILRDSETIRAYAEGWKQMKAEGVPAEIIPDILGKRPYTVGIGYMKVGESTKMDPVQAAMKRSEADALKRRFDLPFAIAGDGNGETIEAEWAEVGDLDDEPAPANPGPAPETAENKEALFGTDNGNERPYSPSALRDTLQRTAYAMKQAIEEQKQWAVELVADIEKYRGVVAGNIEKAFAGDAKSAEKRHSFLAFVWGDDVTSAKDLTEAQVLAHRKHLNWSQDSGGEWVIDELAAKEIRAAVQQRMEEQHAGSLFPEANDD
jgi:hypothetical protein